MGTPGDRDQAAGLDGAAVAATQVATCQWHPQRTSRDYKCNLPVEALIVSVCSLHNPDPNKDLDRFNQTLWEKIEQEETDDKFREINLAGVVFPTDADFGGRVSKKTVTFAEAHFGGVADFFGAQFGGVAHFGGAQFDGLAHFPHAQFGGEADFGGARFSGTAYFGAAQFDGQTFFGRAHFGREVDFRDAQFDGQTSFGRAHFVGETDFQDAHFGREADFQDAQFGGEVGFLRTRFEGTVFEGAQFGGPARFIGTRFPPKNSEAVVHFCALAPESARNLRLEGVDLSRVSSVRTDVSQVQFVDCIWDKKPTPLFWPLPIPRPRLDREAIHDDVAGVEGDRRLVAELYRQLRLNYEANRQEAEAGRFYVGQMEMRRQDTKNYHWLYRGMLAAYRVLAMYGESYLRPPFFYFLFGAVFALAYLWGGFQVGQAQVKYQWLYLDWANTVPFLQHFVRAYVQALTAGGLLGANLFGGQLGTSLETTSWWVPAVRYVNMLLDTFLVGFFVIALRRHFHR